MNAPATPKATPAAFSLMSHNNGVSQWHYSSAHPLNALLEPGYFDSVYNHRPSRGDVIECVFNKPDAPLEYARLIVVTGADAKSPTGGRLPIVVEPAGPAYRERPASKKAA
jgi:hypothetical protein